MAEVAAVVAAREAAADLSNSSESDSEEEEEEETKVEVEGSGGFHISFQEYYSVLSLCLVREVQ